MKEDDTSVDPIPPKLNSTFAAIPQNETIYYLFICGLFNDAANSVHNNRMISEQ
jgi:hypothetical protein